MAARQLLWVAAEQATLLEEMAEDTPVFLEVHKHMVMLY